jgi:DNA-binding response OmpR family regulator
LTHRILIVDDDLHIREVIRVALRKAGMTVFEARDGKEALTRFAADQPDLIVLDIGMPEFDGLDVCREIRKSSDVPILFLSARDEEIDRVLGLEIGGDDYVTKPFSPRELVARVNVILRRAISRGLEKDHCRRAGFRSILSSTSRLSPVRRCASRPSNSASCAPSWRGRPPCSAASRSWQPPISSISRFPTAPSTATSATSAPSLPP